MKMKTNPILKTGRNTALLLAYLYAFCRPAFGQHTPDSIRAAAFTWQQVALSARVLADSVPRIQPLENKTLMESSGLASSLLHNGVLYTHEDSKCANVVYMIGVDGSGKGTLELTAQLNRDWEDIAVSRLGTNGRPYIFLADIGDNGQRYPYARLYRFPEPVSLAGTQRIRPDSLLFNYPGKPVNAETLLVDPTDGGIYVVSKEKDGAILYHIDWPAHHLDTVLAKPLLRMPFIKITGGDISPDGTQIVLRTKQDIIYWRREEGQSLVDAMAMLPERLAHRPEHQSEGITFLPDGSGIVTSTEVSKKSGISPYISIYHF